MGLGALASSTTVSGTHPGLPEIAAHSWQADLQTLFKGLREHHRDLFHHTPADQFRSAIETLHRRIPDLRPLEIVAGFQAIVSMAGDGHTFLFTWDLYRPLPFNTAWFGDDVRVIRTTAEASGLLGLRLTHLDGMPMKEVTKRLDTVIAQAENRWYVLAQRPDRLRRAELLAALGVVASPERMALAGVDDAGVRHQVEIMPLPRNTHDGLLTKAIGPIKPADPDSSFAWARLPEHDAVHLNFEGYGDLPRKAAGLFSDLGRNPPRTLLIDMRHNLGGNYTLPREHIIYRLQSMASINRPRRLFVLIGRHTFSAAMTNALDFRRETEATLVGEPTGARPHGFQELFTFRLPNSGLRVACSARHYRFDVAGLDAVYPDIRVKTDWRSAAAGRDDVVEAALSEAKKIT